MLPKCLVLQRFDNMVHSVRELGVRMIAYCLCENRKSRLSPDMHRIPKRDVLDANSPAVY